MKLFIFIIFYIFSSIFYVFADTKEKKIDNIVAIVNDQIILNSDVDQALSLFKNQGKKLTVPWKLDFFKDKIIEKLIIDSLILQEANKKQIRITKEQVNNVIKNIALEHNMTLRNFKNYILFNDPHHYISYKDYFKNIEKLLKIKIIQDYELRKRIKISEKEINVLFKKLIQDEKKFEKINLSYILIKKHSNDIMHDKKILSKNIINKINQGYDFDKIYIECKKNKNVFSAKKMFWMYFKDFQNNFSETLKVFKKGQILGPILGKKGFYIFKINDIKNNKNIITEFYIQHLLIKPSITLTNSESKKYIFNIYKNIKKEVYTFDYAVKNFSHDIYSSQKKGDLEWISTELFNAEFNKELSYLNKYEISKPIKSNFGWHIVRLLRKRIVDKIYNLKKQEAYNILLEKKMITEKYNWIKDLKNSSYIKILRS
ncbi:peptidylprolyl isomerase [Buchnera aphidicola]|uniref:Chaperone SurA n=1 Tax=Buchnera aphidicola (Artemisaphis artemisicola) TaxID=1241836 RepID=A0A4D6XPE9_9GAMM|nr:peptidylprolyl isomerase [Buchnera aphidicola]QCI15831.1 peptidylprolyl isomerase [Buchnera aphidicola (Artemisaphis artemisicola)]